MDVSHIPLSTRENPPVGYYSYFSNADCIASATGGNYEISIDNNTPTTDTSMLDDIKWLNGQEYEQTNDLADIESVLNKLVNSDYLEEKNIPVTSCFYGNELCGKTEYQSLDSNNMEYSASKHRLDELGACTLCGTELETHDQKALLFKLPKQKNDNNVILTPYLKNDIAELDDQFAGSSLLISRQRQTRLNWNGYNIDNDFINYANLYTNQEKSSKELLYLSGGNVPFALMGMLAVNRALVTDDSARVGILALPKTEFVDANGEPKALSLNELRSRNISRRAIKLVLFQTLDSSSQKISLQSREFGMMEKRLSSINAMDAVIKNGERLGLENDINASFRDIPNRQKVNTVLKEMIQPNNALKSSRINSLAAKIIFDTVKLTP